ncbi:MAG: phage baseplate assembly protein V [Burkholderiaceae bacterium]|nr:phage baseplate assembly protein V [Burkholderiaceae bacterium]
MMERIQARLRGMIARCVVTLINDATKMQGLQLAIMKGQGADDIERFQNYGHTSVPLPGAEGIALAVGGVRAHTVVIAVDDRRFRLVGLASGESALYDDLGHKVHLTRDGIVIDGAGQLVKMVNLTKLRVEADFEATGQIKDLCDSAGGRTMAQMRLWDEGHTHTSSTAGSPTSPPNQAV